MEGRRYSAEQLSVYLSEAQIIKLVDLSILENLSVSQFRFNFVGVLFAGGRINLVLPKFCNNYNPADMDSIRRRYISLFYKIRKEQIFQPDLGNGETLVHSSSKLGFYQQILENFLEFGLYRNTGFKYFSSYDHEISWNKTLESKTPILFDKEGQSVLYYDVISRKAISKEEDILHDFHKDLIIESYKNLGAYLSKYKRPSFSSKRVLKISGPEKLKYLIRSRLNASYTDKDIYILKLLFRYLEYEFFRSSGDLEFIGSKNFHLCWEYQCKKVFRDNKELRTKFMPQPSWELNGEVFRSQSTLIPDVLAVSRNIFFILDAKYYSPIFLNGVASNEPGNQDISKQIIYHLIIKNQVDFEIINAFLIPGQINLDDFIPYFSLDELPRNGSVVFERISSLPTIEVWLPNPHKILSAYLDEIAINL